MLSDQCRLYRRRTFRKHEDWVEGVIVVTPSKEQPDDEDEEAPPDEIFSCGADGKVGEGYLRGRGGCLTAGGGRAGLQR